MVYTLRVRVPPSPSDFKALGASSFSAFFKSFVFVLADEPTGNLDSRSGTEVMQIFQTLNHDQGITTIFVTHDPWIARHTKRVIMLRDGQIIADRQVAEPLIAGESERPSEAAEMEGLFRDVYYGGKEEEYN